MLVPTFGMVAGMSWLTLLFVGMVVIFLGGAIVCGRWMRRERWFTERRTTVILVAVCALCILWWPISALLS